MSMKNRSLLHRTGRDQYGNKGDAPLPTYKPSEKDVKRTNEMQALHIRLNEEFIIRYGTQWLALFDGMVKKEIWSFLHPHKKPSLGTFYSHSRLHASLEDYLNYLLVQNKYWSLLKLGYKQDDIKIILKPFSECGRYMVSYKGGSTFATSI
jgi:hypothetical protein